MTKAAVPQERFVQSGAIELWTESFGKSKKPPILLIMGVAGQGIMWSDSFCQQLAKEFFVIRYDHRDVGQSSHVNYMVEPYTLYDLSDDIIRILDGYGIQKAHLVGASMGGYLAQLCMHRSAERIFSVTLIMSTVDFSSMTKAMMGTLAANDLPPPNKEVLEELKTIGPIDQSNFDSWLFKSLKILKLFNGNECPFDEAEWIPILEKAYLRRNKDVLPAITHNHIMACGQGPMSYYHINAPCPVHVIHGSADPMLPIAHAKKTANHYNGTLTTIDGMGHIRPKLFENELLAVMKRFYDEISV